MNFFTTTNFTQLRFFHNSESFVISVFESLSLDFIIQEFTSQRFYLLPL